MAITDANLLLGRIQPQHFPQVFGRDGKQPLAVEAARAKFAATLLTDINAFLNASSSSSSTSTMSLEQAALGFVRVANEAMCRPIRALMQVALVSNRARGLFPLGSRHLHRVVDYRQQSTRSSPLAPPALSTPVRPASFQVCVDLIVSIEMSFCSVDGSAVGHSKGLGASTLRRAVGVRHRRRRLRARGPARDVADV